MSFQETIDELEYSHIQEPSIAEYEQQITPTESPIIQTLKDIPMPSKALSFVRPEAAFTALPGAADAESSPFARLGSVVANARLTLRLFGLLPIYVRVRKLIRDGESMDPVLYIISFVQCSLCAAFQLLENIAFLTEKGVLMKCGLGWLFNGAGGRVANIYRVAHRAWFLSIICDFARLMREAQIFFAKNHLEKGKITREEAEKAVQWYYDWIRPLAWLPIGWHLSGWMGDKAPGFNLGVQGAAGVLADLRRTAMLWPCSTAKAGSLCHFVNSLIQIRNAIWLICGSAVQKVKSSFLNGRLFDVTFTRIFQCQRKACGDQDAYFDTKSWVDKDEALKSTLAFDIDGNGISGRYYKLLASMSVPIKQTLFLEWHDDRLIPWLHYVPVSQSMEELPELVFYLTSNPSGKEVARQIARQGRQWHTRAFREVDMGLYVYRLLLEMARLQDPQRKANYGLAAAAPTEECASTKTAPAKSGNSPAPKTFGLVALRSGSPIHFTHFSASENGFLLGLPADKQNATCSGKSDGSAVFRLSEGELYLYNTGKKQQRAYTDRSGMGQGVLQYSTVTKNPLPEAFETKGWKIDKSGNLNFADASGFTACPNGPDGSWAVWVATGNSRPGYSEKECLGFNARVSEIEHATSCFYSEYSG
ncbi:unnamed protein product [Fusarium fujikuroi]|nr:unnamed protein product [Fusarium fujikuroi]